MTRSEPRAALLEDWQAAQMLIVLWRVQHYQLTWTRVVIDNHERSCYLPICIPALEGHGTERLKMRLWESEFKSGMQRLPHAQRRAVLEYIECKHHGILLRENTDGIMDVVAEGHLNTAMQRIPEWLSYPDTTDQPQATGWHQHKNVWHATNEYGVTLCGAYQIISPYQPLEHTIGGRVCLKCKNKKST